MGDHAVAGSDTVTSVYEAVLSEQLRDVGVETVGQYRFIPGRRYRADLAIPEHHLIIEVDGGLWMRGGRGGGHNAPLGYEHDRRRDNLAVVNGCWVLRFTPGMIASGEAAETVKKFLEQRR